MKYNFRFSYKIWKCKTNWQLNSDKLFSLLTAAKPHLRPCPYLGRYIVTGLSARPSGEPSAVTDTETSIAHCSNLQFQSLTVGCNEVNTMQFHSSCSVAETSSMFLIATTCLGPENSSALRSRPLLRSLCISVQNGIMLVQFYLYPTETISTFFA